MDKLVSLAVIAGVGAAGLVAVYVWRKGGVANAATAAGAAAVNAAGGAASGAIGAIGAGVGLPTPDETTTDPRVARWIMDWYGHFEASRWSGMPAFIVALGMAPYSGAPPAAGSALAARFPGLPQASYDETERLLRRYPADEAGNIFSPGLWVQPGLI